MALILFDDLTMIKRHCNIDDSIGTDDDDLLELIENAVADLGQRLTGRQLVADDFTEYLDSFTEYEVLLKPNLNSVASIKYYTDDSEDQQTLSTDDYDVITHEVIGRVRPSRNNLWPTGAYDIEIAYNAGYADGECPSPILTWALINISTRYEHREQITIGSTGNVIGEMPDSFANSLLDIYRVWEAC